MRALFFLAPRPKRRASASSTGLPRTMSATCRMRLVEERIYLPLAIASMILPLLLRSARGGAGRLGLFGFHVAAERAGKRELAQLVPDHVLGDEHGDEGLPVMHRDGLPHELGGNHRAAAPGLDGRLLGARARFLHLLQKVAVHERAFFLRSRHLGVPYALFFGRCLTMNLSVRLLLRVFLPLAFLPQG